MSYFSPYVDMSGMHIPSFEDIRDDLINSMKTIFGQDIYIDEDSMDYQQISIFARKIYDTNNLALMAYNNRTPNTSIGVGLDNLCALIGITRKPASKSTVKLVLTGTPSTVITDGQASDGVNKWNIVNPNPVTIPLNGTIEVDAECEIDGNIQALAGTINIIVTPIFGWLSVTNTLPAIPGVDIETDAELRMRYANATLSPSASILEGILASIESISGVTRSKIYENDTNSTDDNGIPAHSIMVVVEGGNDAIIAEEIYKKKTPGCYTYGGSDPVEINVSSYSGIDPTLIRFARTEDVEILVEVHYRKLQGFVPSYLESIPEAIVDYLNNLDIHDTVYPSVLLSVCVNQMASISQPSYIITDLKIKRDPSDPYSSTPISLGLIEAAKSDIDSIILVDDDA